MASSFWYSVLPAQLTGKGKASFHINPHRSAVRRLVLEDDVTQGAELLVLAHTEQLDDGELWMVMRGGTGEKQQIRRQELCSI